MRGFCKQCKKRTNMGTVMCARCRYNLKLGRNPKAAKLTDTPEHIEARIERYSKRAAKGLPLFEGIEVLA